MKDIENAFEHLPIDRDINQFLRELVRELATTLEEAIGLNEARIFISAVGARIGSMMNKEYQSLSKTERLDLNQIASALIDLKRRIDGNFSIVSISPEQIVLTNTRCPFGEYVIGRKSLCMMTSNVFGRIAADNCGYAKVDIERSIAQGDQECRVVVTLKKTGKALAFEAREYFRRD